jgi:hypothetical protein
MTEITIAGLVDAQNLSDNDTLPVSQPGAYNPVTQQQGDTRKAALPSLVQYLEGTLVTKKPVTEAQILNSHLAFAKGKELFGTKAGGAQANLAALKIYNEGHPNEIEQVEIGSESEHLNLNTNETGEFKDHISVDTRDPVTHAAKKEIIAYMSDLHGPFAYHVEFEIEPTPLELAMWRCLPLHGQLVEIALYERLCNRKYVGDDANDTADWWYKTADPEGTIRDVNGAYMRVLDHRGVFSRPAGRNSKYTAANDTPYDGGATGAFTGDAIRNITGNIWDTGAKGFAFAGTPANEPKSAIALRSQNYIADISSGSTPAYLMDFDASRCVPTAYENRSASISSCLCIKY